MKGCCGHIQELGLHWCTIPIASMITLVFCTKYFISTKKNKLRRSQWSYNKVLGAGFQVRDDCSFDKIMTMQRFLERGKLQFRDRNDRTLWMLSLSEVEIEVLKILRIYFIFINTFIHIYVILIQALL